MPPDPAVAGLEEMAAQTFVYAYPLEYCLREISGFATGKSAVPVTAPWNSFGHARELLGPETKFVSPNNDTLYTLAALDLSAGPLRLRVPDSGDRYYVLQFIDAWTNNFAYVGTRATGNQAGEFLLAAPGYAGEIPEGVSLIEVPTAVATIIGRLEVAGAADLEAAHALQDRFSLTPVDAAEADLTGVPVADPRVPEELGWWERVRVQLAAFPPPPADAPFLAAADPLGLTAADSPYVDADPALAQALIAGETAGREKIEQLAGAGSVSPSGWSLNLHLFDYNLDRLGLGTVDSPAWKIADRKTAYATRAVAARVGLFGNHGYEAAYALVYVDADGERLNGARSYEFTLPEGPPVEAFWSLTMYDTPEFLLVANPIDRYSIGDRTEGLQVGEDGSITILMQTESPGPDREANWLPSPPGDFRPIMRMYGPTGALLDGSFELPPIRRVG